MIHDWTRCTFGYLQKLNQNHKAYHEVIYVTCPQLRNDKTDIHITFLFSQAVQGQQTLYHEYYESVLILLLLNGIATNMT